MFPLNCMGGVTIESAESNETAQNNEEEATSSPA